MQLANTIRPLATTSYCRTSAGVHCWRLGELRSGIPYAHVRFVVSYCPVLTLLILDIGQRIVARLRERTYEASLTQEVEFVERGEGDVLSRLSVDTSVVGER